MPADGEAGLALGLQQVPEERVGKNRAHIDWHTDDRAAEVERLVRLGASVRGEESVPGLQWTVMADPEGNEFCVAG
jgi:predicted enzyme related to lactoylglutathione lyase